MKKVFNYIFDKNRFYRIKLRIAEKYFRKQKLFKYRAKLKNKDFSIISSDCVGGLVYHDLGMKFLSPTINLAIPAHDFIKFCENLDYYISLTPVEANYKQRMNDESYPILKIDDIYIHCIHYNNSDDAIKKWEERKTRINWNNILMIFSAKDGFDNSILERIDKLSYPKVLYSNKQYLYEWCCYMKDSKKLKDVGDLTRYTSIFGVKRYEKYFDIIEWINGIDIKKCKK